MTKLEFIPEPKQNGGPRIRLNNGTRMPLIGLGTAGLNDPGVLDQSVEAALSSGYRMFDTGAIYYTEAQLGNSLKLQLPKFGLRREDIFITTKLHPRIPGMQSVEERVEQSLRDLKTDYIDLLLVHYPCQRALREDSEVDPKDERNPQCRRDVWRALEQLPGSKVRSLGVSNYEIRHLEEMKSYATIRPAVNQCEFHPHFTRNELRDYCAKHNIYFEAFSSLGMHAPELVNEPLVQELAKKHNVSAEVLLLAFALAHGVAVIPRSTSPAHVRENIACLDVRLSADDVARLSGLNRDRYYCPTCEPWNVV